MVQLFGRPLFNRPLFNMPLFNKEGLEAAAGRYRVAAGCLFVQALNGGNLNLVQQQRMKREWTGYPRAAS